MSGAGQSPNHQLWKTTKDMVGGAVSAVPGVDGARQFIFSNRPSAATQRDPQTERSPLLQHNKSNDSVVLVSPFMEFMASDAVIFLILATALSLYPTYQYCVQPLPRFPVLSLMSWLLVAFSLGWSSHSVLHHHVDVHYHHHPHEAAQPHHPHTTRTNPSAELTAPHHHHFLTRILELGQKRIQFQSLRPTAVFSALTGSKRRSPWTLDPSVLQDNWLGEYLVRNQYRAKHRITLPDHGVSQEGGSGNSDLGLGGVDTTGTPDSLNMMVDPLFQLRGMDVFLTDNAETDTGSHPWLIQQGLRDVPTVTVNMLTVWGNILIYFTMPDWVENLTTSLETTPEDDDHIIALKEFLRGDAEYRNAHLFIINNVVEAPSLIKLMAPPKTEFPVHNPEFLPLTWNDTDRQIVNGRTLCPTIECQLDCMASRTVRSASGLLKRNLVKLVIDTAVVIRSDTARACLGTLRFHHVDVSHAPHFPDRYTDEALREGVSIDDIRASKIGAQFDEEANNKTI